MFACSVSPGQSWEAVYAAATFRSALASFSVLNVCVGLRFYINVILENNSVQCSKKVSCIQFIFSGKYCFGETSCLMWKIVLSLEGCNHHSYRFVLLFFLRLLAQLHETETAFDEFWIKHQQKLEQCLCLRNFEQNFREVRNSWWQSIFGNTGVIQKQILPLLVFAAHVCVLENFLQLFFLYMSLLDILLSLLPWILAYRDIIASLLQCYFFPQAQQCISIQKLLWNPFSTTEA